MLIGWGIVILAIVAFLFLDKGKPAGPSALLVFALLSAFGPALVLLGHRELTGASSRRRWRAARAQVTRLSTIEAVRWRYGSESMIAPVLGLLFGAPLTFILPLGSMTWALATATLLPFAYWAAVPMRNIRQILYVNNALVYTSGPLRHPRDCVRCALARVLGVRADVATSAHAPTVVAYDGEGTRIELAEVESLELAMVIAETARTLWLGQKIPP